jgi:hypothetical protein
MMTTASASKGESIVPVGCGKVERPLSVCRRRVAVSAPGHKRGDDLSMALRRRVVQGSPPVGVGKVRVEAEPKKKLDCLSIIGRARGVVKAVLAPLIRCVELRAVLNKESSHALVTANKRLVKNAQSPAVFVRRRARAQETRRSLDVPALDRFKQFVGHGFNRVRDFCFRLDTAAAFCLNGAAPLAPVRMLAAPAARRPKHRDGGLASS